MNCTGLNTIKWIGCFVFQNSCAYIYLSLILKINTQAQSSIRALHCRLSNVKVARRALSLLTQSGMRGHCAAMCRVDVALFQNNEYEYIFSIRSISTLCIADHARSQYKNAHAFTFGMRPPEQTRTRSKLARRHKSLVLHSWARMSTKREIWDVRRVLNSCMHSIVESTPEWIE